MKKRYFIIILIIAIIIFGISSFLILNKKDKKTLENYNKYILSISIKNDINKYNIYIEDDNNVVNIKPSYLDYKILYKNDSLNFIDVYNKNIKTYRTDDNYNKVYNILKTFKVDNKGNVIVNKDKVNTILRNLYVNFNVTRDADFHITYSDNKISSVEFKVLNDNIKKGLSLSLNYYPLNADFKIPANELKGNNDSININDAIGNIDYLPGMSYSYEETLDNYLYSFDILE